MFRAADLPLRTFLAGQFALGRDCCPYYLSCLDRFARQLEQFAGRSLWMGDLSDELLNSWAAHLRAAGDQPKTVKNKLSAIVVVWRHAWELRLVERRPERVIRVRCPERAPVAWSAEEFSRLAAAAARVPNYFVATGHRKADWWTALVWVLYDSGLRLSDALDIRRDQFTADGRAVVTQHKTGYVHPIAMAGETWAHVERLGPFEGPRRGGLIFGRPVGRRALHAQFARLLVAAGLDTHHGQSRRIRRTAGTQIERVAPGQAWRFLGHRKPGLDRAAYIDPRYGLAPLPLPPRPEK